jgi:pyridoxine 5-phosphate synthase
MNSHQEPRLGVNIDHIATLRQLRGTSYPDIIEAACMVESAGAHQITVHLREDRRHIQVEDVRRLRAKLRVPLNLEMASTDAMLKFAVKIKPDWACLVPEKRQEVTTEGGLALERGKKKFGHVINKLKQAGIKVSLFIEPSIKSVRLSAELGADAIELHSGRYCIAESKAELDRIRKVAIEGRKLGLHVHAGHGLNFKNVRPLASLMQNDAGEGLSVLIEEYNIGHSIVCRAALVGLERAVREMLAAILAP